MPLLERGRVEVYIPDLSRPHYRNLLIAFEEEFTFAFGGCTIVRGLQGSYLSFAGDKTSDRINVIYTDLPIALSTNFEATARYSDQLRIAAIEALDEEVVMVVALQTFHAV